MARNAEKAMTTLARWRQAQLDDGKPVRERKRRPFLTSECEDLNDAERFRLDITRQISKKVAQIQNAGLGEHRIRDLNDQINKLLREKRRWEERIVELGGTDHTKSKGPRLDADGREVPGGIRGYKYFGAAKDLPGVREILSQPPPSQPRKTRAELMVNIDAAYYGYRDEDDGVIVPFEKETERKAVEAVLGKEEAEEYLKSVERHIHLPIFDPSSEEGVDFVGPRTFISHVPSVPTQKEVQEELLRRKKQLLLEQLGIEEGDQAMTEG